MTIPAVYHVPLVNSSNGTPHIWLSSFLYRSLIRNDTIRLATIRLGLSDLSWWMRRLCQYIALRTNGEDGDGLDRFWHGRYKAVRIIDEESLLACAAYICPQHFTPNISHFPRSYDRRHASNAILERLRSLHPLWRGDSLLLPVFRQLIR